MSSWTYINGVITVFPLGRTQAEKRYILDTVLDHLPKVTGSERDMNTYLIQKSGYNSYRAGIYLCIQRAYFKLPVDHRGSHALQALCFLCKPKGHFELPKVLYRNGKNRYHGCISHRRLWKSRPYQKAGAMAQRAVHSP